MLGIATWLRTLSNHLRLSTRRWIVIQPKAAFVVQNNGALRLQELVERIADLVDVKILLLSLGQQAEILETFHDLKMVVRWLRIATGIVLLLSTCMKLVSLRVVFIYFVIFNEFVAYIGVQVSYPNVVVFVNEKAEQSIALSAAWIVVRASGSDERKLLALWMNTVVIVVGRFLSLLMVVVVVMVMICGRGSISSSVGGSRVGGSGSDRVGRSSEVRCNLVGAFVGCRLSFFEPLANFDLSPLQAVAPLIGVLCPRNARLGLLDLLGLLRVGRRDSSEGCRGCHSSCSEHGRRFVILVLVGGMKLLKKTARFANRPARMMGSTRLDRLVI